MRNVQLTLLVILINWASASWAQNSPAATAVPAPAMTGTPAELFASLEGETCQGAMVVVDAKATAAPVAIGAEWFRKSDGSPWVYFTYSTRPPVGRPVRITSTDLTFSGVFGQAYSFQGNASEISGPTYTDNQNAEIHLNCVKMSASAQAALPLPVDPAQQVDVPSKINGQTYRLMIHVPTSPPPHDGYPVLYVLDANWYFGGISDEAQIEVIKNGVVPSIVVGVGYPTDDQTEIQNHHDFDLTLPVSASTPKAARYGGADAFLQVLDKELKPFVAAHYQVNAAQQTLFGHSFAGLTALRELFREPNAFSAYILASPSIFWQSNEVLADETAFSQKVREGQVHAKILIVSAGLEQKETDPYRMIDNASDLASQLAVLNPQEMPVSRVIVAGETHTSLPLVSASRIIQFANPAPASK